MPMPLMKCNETMDILALGDGDLSGSDDYSFDETSRAPDTPSLIIMKCQQCCVSKKNAMYPLIYLSSTLQFIFHSQLSNLSE